MSEHKKEEESFWERQVAFYDGQIVHYEGILRKSSNDRERAFASHQYAWGWGGKGDSLDRLKRYGEAIECYDKALEIDPKYDEAWLAKAKVLVKLRKPKEALECCDSLLEIYPGSLRGWSTKSDVLFELGMRKEAVECCDRLIQMYPSEAVAWIHKGSLLEKLRRYEEAMKCYDMALRINPNDAWSWVWKGTVLDQLGRREEASVCFQKAVEIDPSPTIKIFADRHNREMLAPSNKGCFIATDMYGPDSLEVHTLRRFRDAVLLKNPIGRVVVSAYYIISPPLAEAISHQDTARSIAKRFLVGPIAHFLDMLLYRRPDE